MLRPLRKANAEPRRVLNKTLKTEAHSPLCDLHRQLFQFTLSDQSFKRTRQDRKAVWID